ncbi:MAG: CocE/NonD family hydrolase [Chromatiales bacterium]|jgi:uncharacterized protein|nr:CocE/NonD family hydrolase [Chromatiales bacterium]
MAVSLGDSDRSEGGLSLPKVRDDLRFRVQEHENVWISLADGLRLAARLWLPVTDEPVSTVLEYLPYRKRDGTATRDALTHPYLAGNGFACVRVDMRGSGESDGLLDDEYLPQEQDDAIEVIDWIVEQSWSNGRVGMMGISWGGFNALQVAFRRPDALKAVVTLCSTDDRYCDDIHYKGGALLNENLGWSATMLAYQSRPPDPMLRDDWREVWLARLEHLPFFAHLWLKHQHRDAFWQHGSICEDPGRVEAAVLAVGGWGDAYSNAVPRFTGSLNERTRGIVGPWVHKYPHFAVPTPAIGFLQEACGWWRRWLDGDAHAAAEVPRHRVYVMDSVRPNGWYTERQGEWFSFGSWPDARADAVAYGLAEGRLISGVGGGGGSVVVDSPPTTGSAGGEFCAIWLGPEMPIDQRHDDACSVCFDSEPLSEPLVVTGAPVLRVTFSADQPVAQLAVRLSDVWPGGAATRMTYAVINLTHRVSHQTPEALGPGREYSIDIQLDDVAYAVPVDHRLRLSVSTAYWPLIWPAPQRAAVTLNLAKSQLLIPTLPDGAEIYDEFEGAQSSPPLAETVLRQGGHERDLKVDLATGRQTLRIEDDFGRRRIDAHGLITETIARERYEIDPSDPLSAVAHTHWTEVVARGPWSTRTESKSKLWSDQTHFHLSAELLAFEDEVKVFEKHWEETVPRDLI